MTVTNNSKDSSARVKRKYVPMKDRVPSGNIPFCERTDLTEEGKSFLFGVEDLQEIASKSNRTLADSRWALPEDRIKAGLKPTPHKMETMPPPIKTEGPNFHAFHQKILLGTGLNSSRWAAPSSFNKPNISRGTPTTIPTRPALPHSSNNSTPEQPYVPPHLRIAEPAIKSEAASGPHLASPFRLPATETTLQQFIPPHLRGAGQVSGGETNNPKHVLAQSGGFSPIKEEKVDVDRSTRALYDASQITGSLMKSEQPGGFRFRNNHSEAHDHQSSKVESSTPAHNIQSVLPGGRLNPMSQVTSSNEEAFLEFMEKEALKKLQAAKMKSSTPPALSKNSLSKFGTKPRPSFNTEVEPKFKIEINESSDQNFQGFLEQKNNAPVANGKKYIKVETSLQPNGQGALPRSVSNGFPSRTDQQKENIKPFSKFDPHAVFSPRNLKTPEQGEAMHQSVHTSQVAVTSSTGWGQNPLTDKKLLNSSILADLNAQKMLPASPVRLTEDILVKNFGFSPHHSIDIFEDRISDTGILEQPREIIRATQGKDATEQLLDWDGSMLPAPCDWETDRGVFDTSFMPKYIQEWQGSGIPCGPSVTVNTNLEGFRSGKQPIDNHELKEPIIQPDSIPDIQNSVNEKARIHQTSDYEAVNFVQKVQKRQQNLQRQVVDSDARLREIMSRPPEVNPFSAKIPMYLRPATKQDASDIALIYNHYMAHSAVTEDQQAISEGRVLELLDYFQDEKLPLIVAVKGNLPPSVGSTKPKLPQYEAIIGFAYADIFNFGLNTKRTGRSRATATLQFYVHHEYTRKGVGSNLLDRLMHSMSFGYAFKNASSWVNPDNDQVYEAGGGGHWHQLLVQLSIERKNDQMYPWFKEFMLNKFFFKEEARLPAVGRTSGHQGKAAVWLDLVFFQNEAAHGDEFQFEG